jgi:hypothetical protein
MSQVLEYSCESGPLLVADVASAALWTGGDDDGSGVVVEYMADDMMKLPKHLLSEEKQGLHRRKFQSLAEARSFEAALLAAMTKLHPKAKALPRYPDAPGWVMHYIGDDRIYSIEEIRDSAYDRACKKIKGGASVVSIDRKHKALFMDQEEGHGWIRPGPSSLMVLRPESDDGYAAKDEIVRAAVKRPVPEPKTNLNIDAGVVLVHAAFSAKDVARDNFRGASFLEGATAQLARAEVTPLKVGDPAERCGALVRLEPGEYGISYEGVVDLAGFGASVLRLSPRGRRGRSS